MFEALPLMQTGKGRQMPIDENECGLLPVVNEPREVTDAIFDFHEMRGFRPSPAQREVLLNL